MFVRHLVVEEENAAGTMDSPPPKPAANDRTTARATKPKTPPEIKNTDTGKTRANRLDRTPPAAVSAKRSTDTEDHSPTEVAPAAAAGGGGGIGRSCSPAAGVGTTVVVYRPPLPRTSPYEFTGRFESGASSTNRSTSRSQSARSRTPGGGGGPTPTRRVVVTTSETPPNLEGNSGTGTEGSVVRSGSALFGESAERYRRMSGASETPYRSSTPIRGYMRHTDVSARHATQHVAVVNRADFSPRLQQSREEAEGINPTTPTGVKAVRLPGPSFSPHRTSTPKKQREGSSTPTPTTRNVHEKQQPIATNIQQEGTERNQHRLPTTAEVVPLSVFSSFQKPSSGPSSWARSTPHRLALSSPAPEDAEVKVVTEKPVGYTALRLQQQRCAELAEPKKGCSSPPWAKPKTTKR